MHGHPLFVSDLLCLDILIVAVQLLGPVAYSSDMQGEVVLVLWGGADSERVPLKGSDLGNLDEDPVSGVVLEVIRLLDGQLCYPENKTA